MLGIDVTYDNEVLTTRESQIVGGMISSHLGIQMSLRTLRNSTGQPTPKDTEEAIRHTLAWAQTAFPDLNINIRLGPPTVAVPSSRGES